MSDNSTGFMREILNHADEPQNAAAQHWHHDADVVIVGTGVAGCSTAVHSLDRGLSVIMLEKAATTGGTSAKSSGGMLIPNNRYLRELAQSDPREDFVRFLARVGRPLLYDPSSETLGLPEWEYKLIVSYYDHAAPSLERLEAIGAVGITHIPDFPSYNEVDEDKRRLGRVVYGASPDGETIDGRGSITRFINWITQHGGRLLNQHRVNEVIRDSSGRVIGVTALSKGRPIRIRANRAVVFATGGFTHNEELAREYLNGLYVGGCAARTSEGDLIPIAKGLGLPLYQMSAVWGAPVQLEQALEKDPTLISNFALLGDSMVAVNKYGKRTANEKVSYNDRTQAHFTWDPHRTEYPDFLQFAIFDQHSREKFARVSGTSDVQNGNFIPPVEKDSPWLLKGETIAELADAIRGRLAKLSKQTGGIQLSDDFASQVDAVIERFNVYAESGVDPDFHRGETAIERHFNDRADDNDKPNQTMYPISAKGPYYAAILAPGAIDTKGGPKVNTSMQMLDGLDRPVPGLYGIGNCVASASGQAYWTGGSTWGPYVAFGLAAAKAIAEEPVSADA